MGPNTVQEALTLAREEGAAAARCRQAGLLEEACAHLETANAWLATAIELVAERAGVPQDVPEEIIGQGKFTV